MNRRREIRPAGRQIEPATAPADASRSGRSRPGIAELRLIGPPAVIDAAKAMLAEAFPDLYHPAGRTPARRGGGDIQYGTLIVPVTES